MKVLYLAPPRRSPDRLTAFTFIDEEIVALAKRGVEVFVLTYSIPDHKGQSPSHPGVHLHEVPRGRSLREFLRVIRFLWPVRGFLPRANWLRPHSVYQVARVERIAADLVCDEDIDLIHSNFGWPDGYGGVLAKAATGCPLVTTLRGMDVIADKSICYGLRLGRSYDRALRVLLKTVDRTTCVSDFVRDLAVKLGAPASTVQTVHKGVDCEKFKPQKRSAGTTPTVLTVAGLIKRKGVDYILRGLAMLKESHDFRLVVVGDGPERDSLESLASELGLRSRTDFEGYIGRDQIHHYFAACDIFILASVWEASGNVALEAQASGHPVIGTSAGGVPEYIVEGETGFVVAPKDAAAIADKTRQLLDNVELRERFGHTGRSRVTRLFRYSRMIDDIVAVYCGVTGVELREAA